MSKSDFRNNPVKFNPPYSPRYFSEAEFARCAPPCFIDDMSDELLYKLDQIRQDVGKPLRITCAFRSMEYDKAKGRSGDSRHCRGLAVDIACSDSETRQKILKSALSLGLNGIGIAKTFIHIDIRPYPACWLYD